MAESRRLTKTVVDRATYQGQGPKAHCILWDSELPGFGLRIYPSGTKAFLVAYRIGTRKRRVIVGPYGRYTVDEARKAAKKLLLAASDGRDWAEEREKARRGETVADLCQRYLEVHLPKKKASSGRHDRRMLRSYVIPNLGRLKVADVKRADIAKLHHSLRETPYEANRFLALCSKLFNLAEEWGLRPDGSNPTHHVQRFREQKRQRFLSGEELARLGEALRLAAEERKEPASAILALRLLILTGARLSEVLTLRWSSVDTDNGMLHLPDSKTGPRVIPIGAPVLVLLAAAPRQEGNPYVCPGEKAGHHFVGLPRVWQRIRRRAGLNGVRLHDLRHTHASSAAGLGTPLQIIGALLGHSGPQTTARYAHLADSPVRAAANHVTNHIAAVLDGQPAGEVIAFKKP
jgi:integrase